MALIECDKGLLKGPLRIVHGEALVGKLLVPARILGGVATSPLLSCAVMLTEGCLPYFRGASAR